MRYGHIWLWPSDFRSDSDKWLFSWYIIYGDISWFTVVNKTSFTTQQWLPAPRGSVLISVTSQVLWSTKPADHLNALANTYFKSALWHTTWVVWVNSCGHYLMTWNASIWSWNKQYWKFICPVFQIRALILFKTSWQALFIMLNKVQESTTHILANWSNYQT